MSTAFRKCRQGLVAALLVASVFSSASAVAQQPAAPAAPAQPPAQAAPPPPSPILTGLRQGVQRLRDQERQLAQEREQRFRAELQRVERQAQEATQRRNAAEARSNALDRQWNDNEQTHRGDQLAVGGAARQPRRAVRRDAAGRGRCGHDAPAVVDQRAICRADGRRRGARGVLAALGRRHGVAVDHRARALVVRDASRDDGVRQSRQIPRGCRAGRQRGDAGRRKPAPGRAGRRASRSVHREQPGPIPRLFAGQQIADGCCDGELSARCRRWVGTCKRPPPAAGINERSSTRRAARC